MRLKKGLRVLAAALFAAVLTVSQAACILAAESGKISVDMYYGTGDSRKALDGGTLSVYRVGNAVQKDGTYVPVLNEAFADSGVDLSTEVINTRGAEIAAALSDFALTNQIAAVKTADVTNGNASFTGMEEGFYLVTQTVATSGYNAMSPFICMLPQGSETGWRMDVTAKAKISKKNSGGGGGGGGGGGSRTTDNGNTTRDTGVLSANIDGEDINSPSAVAAANRNGALPKTGETGILAFLFGAAH